MDLINDRLCELPRILICGDNFCYAPNCLAIRQFNHFQCLACFRQGIALLRGASDQNVRVCRISSLAIASIHIESDTVSMSLM